MLARPTSSLMLFSSCTWLRATALFFLYIAEFASAVMVVAAVVVLPRSLYRDIVVALIFLPVVAAFLSVKC